MSHTPETTATRPHTGPEHAAFGGQQRGGESCKREKWKMAKDGGTAGDMGEEMCERTDHERKKKTGSKRNRREKKQRGEMEMEKGEEQEARED